MTNMELDDEIKARVAIGQNAGYTGQGQNCVAIGTNEGYSAQIPYSNIIGNFNQDGTIGSTGYTYIGRIRK